MKCFVFRGEKAKVTSFSRKVTFFKEKFHRKMILTVITIFDVMKLEYKSVWVGAFWLFKLTIADYDERSQCFRSGMCN